MPCASRRTGGLGQGNGQSNLAVPAGTAAKGKPKRIQRGFRYHSERVERGAQEEEKKRMRKARNQLTQLSVVGMFIHSNP